MQGPLQIFISYVTKDEQIASAVKEYLQAVFLNASVFVSKEDLNGGEVWFEQLRAVLASSTAVIGIVTPASVSSTWVHFELGARFIDRHAIPLVGGGITFESLPAPFKHLQARAIDENGLKTLARDVARLAEMREPVGFPGLEDCIERVRTCLARRAPPSAGTVDIEPAVAQIVKDRERQRLAALDQEFRAWANRLLAKTRQLLIRDIGTRSATFKIPAKEELERTQTVELVQLARELGADLSTKIMFASPGLDSPPRSDESDWKKAKAKKEYSELEGELGAYEAAINARSKKRASPRRRKGSGRGAAP